MKKIISEIVTPIVIVLFGAVVVVSCSQPENRENVLRYYVNLNEGLDTVGKKLDVEGDHLIDVMNRIQQMPDGKLDSNSVDTLKRLNDVLLAAFDASSKMISGLQEIDPEANLKQKTLAAINKCKEFDETVLVKMIDFFGTGMGNLSNEQKEVFDQFEGKFQEITKELMDLSNAYKDFAREHKVTKEELSKLGYK